MEEERDLSPRLDVIAGENDDDDGPRRAAIARLGGKVWGVRER